MDKKRFRAILDKLDEMKVIPDPLLLVGKGKSSSYNASDIKKFWSQYTDGVQNGSLPETVNFYTHIPFCRQKCEYCSYFSKSPEDGEIELYLGWMTECIEYFKDVFQDIQFTNFYMGGGTPVIIDENNLERILFLIFNNYRFHHLGEKTCEVNPAYVTSEKLKILKAFDFNRISMGVQTFSKKALSLSNRSYQTLEMVKHAIDRIQSLDLHWGLNIDLIRGLEGDTPSSFSRSFKTICSMGPSQIIVYPLLSTNRYLYKFFPGGFKEFSERHKNKTSSLPEEIESIADSFGYEHSNLSPFSSWVFTAPSIVKKFEKLDDKYPERFFYDDIPLLPFSLFGLGPSSRSNVFSHISYSTTEGIFSEFDRSSPIYTGIKTSHNLEMIKFIILSFRRESSCSISKFKNFFGFDIDRIFSPSFQFLHESGFISVNDDKIEIVDKNRKNILACCICFYSNNPDIIDFQ